EGRAARRLADSLYQTTSWSPQLLYLEAVYHLQQQQDSLAIESLKSLIAQNPASPVAAKATNMIEVVKRRKEIEEELRNLQIERPAEEAPVVFTPPPVTRDTVTAAPPAAEEPAPLAIRRDSTALSTVNAPAKPRVRSAQVDTASRRFAAPPDRPASGYQVNADAPHMVLLILRKVDAVFVNEARNAFSRFNRERYYSQPMEIGIHPLNDSTKLLVIGAFNNAVFATDYVQKAMKSAASEIVPWLKAENYSFTIISAPNLDFLKANPDLDRYLKFLEQNMQVKF
ncbi:MAG TPA: hypothetical protein VHK69_18410, partial [Chitinophagaceae bacterium]|nr:hypothetical protein [Chitinophagaceae bacterium]